MNFDVFMNAVEKKIKDECGNVLRDMFEICTDCKCVLFNSRAESVRINGHNCAFCGRCKPPYDEAILVDSARGSYAGYTKDTFFKNRVEVDKNGKVLKD